MIDEYIQAQLDRLMQERQKLQEELQEVSGEEEQANHQISELLDQEDVGFEIFSPRAGDNTVKNRISQIQKHIEDLQYKQAGLTQALAENQDRLSHYERLMDEAHIKEEPAPAENKTEEMPETSSPLSTEGAKDVDASKIMYLAELKSVLEKVDTCINLVGHNRNQCKSELKNLRYHLRTVISEAESDM